MAKNILQFTFFILFVVSMVADYRCGNPSFDNISEGKIVYEVTYPDNPEFNASDLPSELTLYFKDNKTCIEFNSADGNSNTRIIADSNTQIYSALINATGHKTAMTFNKEDVKNNFKDRVPLKISFTENKKQIAGIECKEAVCMDSSDNLYSVYYCDTFKIKDPNWTTSFNEIPGVLMEYQVNLNNVVMNLKAKSISIENIDPQLFIVPPGFKIISHLKNPTFTKI